jgi:hypothetical protein
MSASNFVISKVVMPFFFGYMRLFLKNIEEDEVPFKCNRNLFLVPYNPLKFVQGKENN